MLTVDIPSETEARLEAIAKAKGQTVTEYLRELVLCAVEDALDIADAESVLADIKAGRQTTISHEELVKKYFSEP